MSAVRTGIYSYFRSDNTAALYTDLSGERLYYSEAVEQATLPYCVFQIYDEIPDETFDLDFEEALVQFSYYGSTADVVDDGAADIKTMFDNAAITVAGHTVIRMKREFVFHPEKIMPDNIWVSIVRYSIFMVKN